MVYRILADAVVVTHFAFIAFVVTGPYLARRRRSVVWLHLPALAWAVGIIAVGYECPLTALENHFRRLAGERVYPGGFVDHYIENVIYPQRFTPLVLILSAVLIAAGYAGLVKAAPAAHSRPQRLRARGGTQGDLHLLWCPPYPSSTRPHRAVAVWPLPGGRLHRDPSRRTTRSRASPAR